MVQNVPKCFKTVQNGPKFSRMVHTLSKLFQNCPKWFKMVYYSIIWWHFCLQNHLNGSGITRSPGLVLNVFLILIFFLFCLNLSWYWCYYPHNLKGRVFSSMRDLLYFFEVLVSVSNIWCFVFYCLNWLATLSWATEKEKKKLFKKIITWQGSPSPSPSPVNITLNSKQ